jgi:hypothetical protein
MRKCGIISFAFLLFAFAGCAKLFRVEQPSPDHAIVSDHMIEGTGGLDYALIAIDGRPVEKEKVPKLVDMMPGAVVGIGPHQFTVSVAPHLRPPGYVPHETVFTASVDGGKRYFVGTKDGLPVLVEAKMKPNKSSQSTTTAVTPPAGQEARQP